MGGVLNLGAYRKVRLCLPLLQRLRNNGVRMEDIDYIPISSEVPEALGIGKALAKDRQDQIFAKGDMAKIGIKG